MIISYVTREDLDDAAVAVPGIRLEVEDRSTSRRAQFRVRLFPDGETHRATNPRTRRRLNACTPHAHLLYFRALYRRNPGAMIKTTCATYTSRINLEEMAPHVMDEISANRWPVGADPHMDTWPVGG